jgi:soluble lytic murein transglycosylase
MALTSAMEDGNIVFADAYMKAHKADMNADDVLRVRGTITKEMDGRMGLAAAQDAVAAIRPAFATTDLDRAKAIVKSLETGSGSGFKADGTMVEGPQTKYGTAKGPMQVLDGTTADPGFGVRPARDNSPAERTRVGQDYFEAMVKRYNGDLALAYGAYNGGPGHVDEALKAAADPANKGKSWLDFMRPQTQDYVANGMKAYSSGLGQPPTPTLEDALARIDADPRVNTSPARLDYARREVTARFEAMTHAKKSMDDDAMSTALRLVEANGGNYMALPVSVRSAIPSEKLDTVMNFADKVRGGNTVTNLAVYQRLTDDKALKGLNDSQFFNLRPELSPGDFQHFAEQRAKLLDPKANGNGPGDLNTPALHMAVENRLQSLGINPTPKAADTANMERIGAVNRFVREQVLLAQQQHGKKFNDAETEAYVDTLFAKSIPFRNTVLGITVGTDNKRMLEMKPSDIPSESADAIRAAFKKRGINSPSDGDVLAAYWRTKSLAGR